MSPIFIKTKFGGVVATLHFPHISFDFDIITDKANNELSFDDFIEKYPLELFKEQVVQPFVAELEFLFSGDKSNRYAPVLYTHEFAELTRLIDRRIKEETAIYDAVTVRELHYNHLVDLPF